MIPEKRPSCLLGIKPVGDDQEIDHEFLNIHTNHPKEILWWPYFKPWGSTLNPIVLRLRKENPRE